MFASVARRMNVSFSQSHPESGSTDISNIRSAAFDFQPSGHRLQTNRTINTQAPCLDASMWKAQIPFWKLNVYEQVVLSNQMWKQDHYHIFQTKWKLLSQVLHEDE